MVVSKEPLVSQVDEAIAEEEAVAADVVSITSTLSSQGQSNSQGDVSNQEADDNNSKSSKSISNHQSSRSISSSNNDDNQSNQSNDNNGDNTSKASAATKSSESSSSCELTLPDADQRFRLQVTGYSPRKGDTIRYGEVIDQQFCHIGPSGQKEVISLPQQLHDYIPDDVWKVFGVAIMAPLSDGANREHIFAMRMHVMAVFIPCVLAWVLMTIIVRERNSFFVAITLSFLAAVFWSIMAVFGVWLVLRIARRDMEAKTFRLIENSASHWAPIFRGLGWNVAFEIDELSRFDRKSKGIPKSYLVFEPVGSVQTRDNTPCVGLSDQV